MIKKHNITADYIYIWDEKGFLIGLANTMKRILNREAFQSSRVCHARQNRNREFVSFLACVSALGKSLLPCLIYAGESGDLQEAWVTDLKPDEKAYFGISSTGWSSDMIGLKYLQLCFMRTLSTKESAF